MNRIALCLALVPSVAALWPAPARALDDAACCLQSTSKVDGLLNPARGSDEKFFGRSSGPPNVVFILDNSQSMKAWPETWSSAKGCSWSEVNGLGYDKSVTYPKMKGSVTATDPDVDDWFDTAKYCSVPSSGYGQDYKKPPSATLYSTLAAACASPIPAADKALCQQCLTEQGYFIENGSTRRVSGNFLNFYAPRDSGSVHVLTNIISDLKEVRLALFAINKSSNADKCFFGTHACVVAKAGPSCDKSFPWDQSNCDSNRNSILNTLTQSFGDGTGTPITGALYSAGYYFSTHDGSSAEPIVGYNSSWPSNADFNGGNRPAVCFECGFNAIILISDGEPNSEIDPPKPMKDMSASSNAAKVAQYLWTHDLRSDMAGTQKVATYAIGLSTDASNSSVLQEIANKGGGQFYPATSTAGLRDAILQIFEDIARRNTAFSTATLASVQSGSSSMAAIMPRMLPVTGRPWTGDLYRFELFNEFVLDQDKNLDGDKSDVFVVDSTEAIVVEDGEGKFVRQAGGAAATPYWEARSLLKSRGHALRSIWTVLDQKNGTGAATKDGLLTEHDGLVEFKADNWADLIDYLGLKGTGACPTGSASGEEGTFLAKLGLSVSTVATAIGYTFPLVPTQANYQEFCARMVIQYVRGQDLDDEDSDNDRTDTRDTVLGDIFHSSPVVVDPPVDKFLCDLGLHNQCIRTLYSDQLGIPHTPLATYSEDHCGVTREWDAYEKYAWDHRRRARAVLVGANDGMLHAFHDGAGTAACSNGVSTTTYDEGTGVEAWAFIPPDQLPRLVDVVQGHQFYVDGDLMVRDVWADDNGDGRKQAGEYHTLAVAAEGRGGTHYFALEIQWDSSANALALPAFRWIFPQPCSEEASEFGKTLFALSPKAPPIGPVLLDTSTTSGLVGLERHGTSGPETAERWVAFLSGGWSPSLEKGRGIYMVDAWNGLVQDRGDNLWWKLAKPADGSSAEDGERLTPLRALTHSIVAPVALADYGSNQAPKLDGFFDTAVVGDTRGQVWVSRFYQPGRWDSTAKTVTNWSGARAFEQDRNGTILASGATKSVKNDWPFFFPAELALQPDNGALRVYLGTGDRYSILEESAGACRWDSPLPCAKYGCTETTTASSLRRLTRDVTRAEMHWKDLSFDHATQQTSAATRSACGSVGEVAASASILESKITGCPAKSGTLDRAALRNVTVECRRNSLTDFACTRTDSNAVDYANLAVVPTSARLASLGKNRFYGFWAYGGKTDKTFEEDRDSSTSEAHSPSKYDDLRVTDRSASSGSGDLLDVTGIACQVDGSCKLLSDNSATSGAGPTEDGWLLEYSDGLEFRTATGAAVLASCALWNNLHPVVAGTTACSSTSAMSRFYQSHYISGLPNCAAGLAGLTKSGTYLCTTDSDCLDGGTCTDGKCSTYARYRESSVLTPPPEPKVVVQVSATGQIKYSAMTPEPGKSQVTSVDVSVGNDLLQSVYELPVSRRLHQCRHVNAEACAPVPP